MNGMNNRVAATLLAMTVAAASPAAFGADIIVSDFGDVIDDADGTCSLREAIRSANGDIAIDGCTAGDGTDLVLLGPHTYTLDLTIGTDEDASCSSMVLLTLS